MKIANGFRDASRPHMLSIESFMEGVRRKKPAGNLAVMLLAA